MLRAWIIKRDDVVIPFCFYLCKMKRKSLKVHKAIKKKMREDYIAQGGQDGRYREKVVPDKKRKYNRQKAKKVNNE